MKNLLKLSLIVVLVTLSSLSYAQKVEYGRFKGDIMGGYAYPFASYYKFGFVMSLEPKYNVTSNVAVGLRLEVPGFIDNDIDARILQAFTPTVEYYFGHGRFRPFVGAMGGMYRELEVATGDEEAFPTAEKTLFGGGVRVGAQVGGFRFEIAPNLLAGENTYVSIKLGGTIGGKRK